MHKVKLVKGYSPDMFSALFAIEQQCFTPPDQFTQARMRAYLKKDLLCTAQVNGVLVGSLLALPTKSIYIASLAVLPGYQGQGIGKRLMLEVERDQNPSSLWLHVNATSPAQKFYFDLGYRVTKVVQRFYGSKSTGFYSALVMKKKIR